MPRFKLFNLIFILIVALELVILQFPEYLQLRWVSKPLILMSLILYTWNQNLLPKLKRLLLLGLLFSLAGDIFLLFKGELFFMLGLVSFLIAHLFYIALFFKKNTILRLPVFIISILLGLYAYWFISVIGPKLGGLYPYVFIYMVVLLSMTISAFSTNYHKPKNIVFLFAFIGALLFTISDSILAWDKFYNQISNSGIWIMFTYAFAQFCIVKSIVIGNKTPQ